MRKMRTLALAAGMAGLLALGGIETAKAADMVAPVPPPAYAPPPVAQTYAYPPPPVVYGYPPPLAYYPAYAVWPGPYYARFGYWHGYGQRFAYYGWSHGWHR